VGWEKEKTGTTGALEPHLRGRVDNNVRVETHDERDGGLDKVKSRGGQNGHIDVLPEERVHERGHTLCDQAEKLVVF